MWSGPPLCIKTRRYEGIALENRLCQLCNSSQVETQIHFLTSCNAFSYERNVLYNVVNQCLILIPLVIRISLYYIMLTKRRSLLYT